MSRPSQSSVPLAWWLRLGGLAPLSLWHFMARPLAWFTAEVLRFRRAVVLANLARCLPELDAPATARLVRRHYRCWSETALELLKLAGMSADDLRARVELRNPQLLREQLAAGRAVMLLCAHQANWEWLGHRVCIEFPEPTVGVYKPLRSAWLDRQVLRLRSHFGIHMVAGKSLPRELARRRGAPHLLIMLADQMPLSSPTRHWVSFFGQRTAFFPGPEALAARFDYWCCFMHMQRRSPGRYTVEFQPLIIDPAAAAGEFAVTRAYGARVEAAVRAAPHDWAWGHRRWKDVPGAQG